MKSSSIALLAWFLSCLVQAEEGDWSDAATTGEAVSIPGTIGDGGTSPAPPKPEDPEFNVLSSTVHAEYVEQTPPMPGLPPVSGTRTITIQRVEQPDFAKPSEPLPDLEPDDPAVEAELERLRENFRGIELIFLSATVYDKSRTFLRIYPDGVGDKQVTAWSNLPFHHFGGFSTFRVTKPDGGYRDYGLLLGLGHIDTESRREFAERRGAPYTEPTIPELPDLEASGPAYLIAENADDETGDPGALASLERLHVLYAEEGDRMAAAYAAREEARETRKAELLANPPEPEDVIIRFWKRSPETSGSGKEAVR